MMEDCPWQRDTGACAWKLVPSSAFKMLTDKLPPFPQTSQGPSFDYGMSPLSAVLISLPALAVPCYRNMSRAFVSCMLPFTCCRMVGLCLAFWSGDLVLNHHSPWYMPGGSLECCGISAQQKELWAKGLLRLVHGMRTK